MSKIPVMRSKLPATERLVPYLKKIDATRIYSNYGPLTRALEERLAEHFRLGSKTITTVANATLGLSLALSAQGARPGTLCAIPAWTFVASAHAATLAGLVPYFIDVDSKSGMLDPDRIHEEIARGPGVVSAVMPVAPFGQPVDIAGWDRFQSRTGLAVVIDGAASFDTLRPGAVPTVVSLGATKVLGIGEGGFVASTDAALIQNIRARANMGFRGTRQALSPAVNAKLSEYHAAVGLAALDEWQTVREEWMAVARLYRAALAESNRLKFQAGFGQMWISSTCVLSLSTADAVSASRDLEAADFDSRKWWGDGAHTHPATAACPRSELPVTETLARAAIGVPFYRDLAANDVRRIADVVLSVAAASEDNAREHA